MQSIQEMTAADVDLVSGGNPVTAAVVGVAALGLAGMAAAYYGNCEFSMSYGGNGLTLKLSCN